MNNLQNLDGGIGTPLKPTDLAHQSIINDRNTMRGGRIGSNIGNNTGSIAALGIGTGTGTGTGTTSKASSSLLRNKLFTIAHHKVHKGQKDQLELDLKSIDDNEIPVEKCLAILLHNPNITCPDFDHVEICVVQHCLNNMAVDAFAAKVMYILCFVVFY